MPADDCTAKVWNLPNERIGAQLVDAADAMCPGSAGGSGAGATPAVSMRRRSNLAP